MVNPTEIQFFFSTKKKRLKWPGTRVCTHATHHKHTHRHTHTYTFVHGTREGNLLRLITYFTDYFLCLTPKKFYQTNTHIIDVE
jgi:hypothetical protein